MSYLIVIFIAIAAIAIIMFIKSRQSEKPFQNPSTKKQIMIPNGVGLGDNKNLFDELFGKSKATSISTKERQVLHYMKGLITVTFVENIASSIFIQYEGYETTDNMNKERAEQDIRQMMPKDAVKIRDYHDSSPESNLYIIVYSSKLLTTIFSEDQFKDEDGKIELGKFVVAFDLDENNLVYNTSIDLGINP